MAGLDSVTMAKRVLDHHKLEYEVKRGKHIKIVVQHGTQRQTLVTGASLSDRRAVQNFYHLIRRLLTQMGVPFQECKGLMHN